MIISAAGPTPNVLLIHGFLRTPAQLQSWAGRIPDLGFLHLPGHGLAPAYPEVSVQTWADALGEVIGRWPRPPLIIAESLGAILALSVPARAVIAVEPVLSVENLWPLHRTIRNARARGASIPPELETLFSQSFHWVLDRISAPTLLLGGAVPLLPERDVFPEPSVLTDEDFALYAAHPLVEAAHRIAHGHTLLDHNPEGVMDAAAEFMARHGYLAGTGGPPLDHHGAS